jgi:hypothetical protein
MQDIDPTFDEKNLGKSKFSKFCQEAAEQGLIKVIKLENGQLEVAPTEQSARAGTAGIPAPRAPGSQPAAAPSHGTASSNGDREDRGRRGRRGRGGRGRGDDRRDREVSGQHPVQREATPNATASAPAPHRPSPISHPQSSPSPDSDPIGKSGERLTRDEAFDLVRRAATAMVQGDAAVPASSLRRRAFELLGRDSESLNERFFNRVLRDAHDADIIDLRRRGDDFEVALPSQVAPVAAQLNRAAAAHAAPVVTAPAAPALRGMGPRGIPAKGRGGRGAPPADLLLVGVVETPPAAAPATVAVAEAPAAPAAKGRAPRAKAKGKTASAETKSAPKKKARAPRAKKSAEAAE